MYSICSSRRMHERTINWRRSRAATEIPHPCCLVEHGPHDLHVFVGARHHLPVQLGPLGGVVDVPHHRRWVWLLRPLAAAAVLLWAEDGACFPEGRCDGAYPRTHISTHAHSSTGEVKPCRSRERERELAREMCMYSWCTFVYMKALLVVQEAGRMMLAKGNVC